MRQIALGQRAPNVCRLIPKALDIRGPVGKRLFGLGEMASRPHSPQFSQNIFTCAACKACHQDSAVALPDRETGMPVIMGRASAHRDIAAPCTTQHTYDIDKCLRGSSGCKGHDAVSFRHSLPRLPSISAAALACKWRGRHHLSARPCYGRRGDRQSAIERTPGAAALTEQACVAPGAHAFQPLTGRFHHRRAVVSYRCTHQARQSGCRQGFGP